MKSRFLGRLGLGALAVALTAAIAIAAVPLKLSTGTAFLPGPRLIDGADLNIMLNAVNVLRNQVDGTTAIGNCTATGASPQTCNGRYGVVTTNTLTTAAATAASFVINDSIVTANSNIECSNTGYSGTLVTNGYPEVMVCTPGAGTITVSIVNSHAANALNGTVRIGFLVTN